MADQKTVSPDQAQKETQKTVKTTNSDVEKAAAEAAKLRTAATKDLPDDASPRAFREPFNTTDAVLGRDEDHGKNVAKAQAQSLGIEYQEPQRVDVAPVSSQNQNNLKHPASDEYTDPHMSQNYLGQPI